MRRGTQFTKGEHQISAAADTHKAISAAPTDLPQADALQVDNMGVDDLTMQAERNRRLGSEAYTNAQPVSVSKVRAPSIGTPSVEQPDPAVFRGAVIINPNATDPYDAGRRSIEAADEGAPLLGQQRKKISCASIKEKLQGLAAPITKENGQRILEEATHTLASDVLFLDRVTQRVQDKFPTFNRVRAFAEGMRFATHFVWPAVFSVLITKDAIAYFASGLSDYGVNIPQILAGNAYSQEIWTSYLGSDLVTEAAYWAPAATLFGLTAAAGAVNLVRNWNKNYERPEMPPDGNLVKRFLAWSQGRRFIFDSLKDVGIYASFWSLTAYLLYAEARLFELWIKKLMGAKAYDDASDDCHAQNKTYAYSPEEQGYACVVCPSSYIPYWKQGDTQSCLDGLLSQNLSPEDTLSGIDLISRHHDFDSVTSTQIDFMMWTAQQFNTFLDSILKSGVRKLRKFEISSSEKKPFFPNDERVTGLRDFFTQVKVDRIILRNQGIGPQIIGVLAPTFNSAIKIDVAGNDLTDPGVCAVVNNLNPHAQSVIFDDNNISDQGMTDILPLLPPSVQHGSFKKNDFSGPGLQAAGEWISKGNARDVDLSGNPGLATADFDQFGKKMEGSALKKLSLEQCGLDDSVMEYFTPHLRAASLEDMSVAENPITSDGFNSALQNCANTTVRRANFRRTLINGAGLRAAGPSLQKTDLEEIDLSELPASLEGFRAFSAYISRSHLKSFRASGNPYLGDPFLQTCRDQLTGLESVELDGIKATDAGAVPFMKAAGAGHLKRIRLANNQNITDVTVGVYAANPGNVTDLNLSGNKIGGKGGIPALSKTVAFSMLRKLIISNNPGITPEEMYELATQLLTGVPSKDLAGYNRDQIRWAQTHAKPASDIKLIDVAGNPQSEKEMQAFSLIAPRTGVTLSTSTKKSVTAALGILASTSIFTAKSVPKPADVGPALMNVTVDFKVALGVSAFGTLLLILVMYAIYKSLCSQTEILPTYNLGGRNA